MGVRRGALCTSPPSSCLYLYSFNSSHLFIEQKGDFVARTGLEDLGNSQRHLPIQ